MKTLILTAVLMAATFPAFAGNLDPIVAPKPVARPIDDTSWSVPVLGVLALTAIALVAASDSSSSTTTTN